MKNILTSGIMIAIFLTSILGMTSNVSASETCIDFDTYPDASAIPAGTIIQNQYQSLGVIFDSGGVAWSTDEAVSYPNFIVGSPAAYPPSAPGAIYPITFHFEDPSTNTPAVTESVSFTLISVGWAEVTYTAKNRFGAILHADSITYFGSTTVPEHGLNQKDPVTISSVGPIHAVDISITRIHPISWAPRWQDGIGIDDLCFDELQTPCLTTTDLIAGGGNVKSQMDVGDVEVWNDDETLYVTYSVTGSWVITETHLEVKCDLNDIPQTKKYNPIPGQFSYMMTHNPPVTEYTYPIDLSSIECDELYIAAHAVVVRPLDDCYDVEWQIGDVEVVNAEEGWLENYADEFNWGDPAGPTTLGPSLAVTQPLFTDPFIVGITTDEFPYNSNFNRGYATDFDVQWDGSLLFGGRLTFSWSPGASAAERKVVSGDGISTTTFNAQGANTPGQGWFLNKYPLVQHSVDVSALPGGAHTIRFQHTKGDGTFWDWIRLERICVQEETAWGEGEDFDGKNWATYFQHEICEPCTEWNLEGDWVLGFEYRGTTYQHDMTIITQDPDGTFEGQGNFPVGGSQSGTWHNWDVTGIVECDTVSFHIVYTESSMPQFQPPPTKYEIDATGTIAPDGTMSGLWSSSGSASPGDQIDLPWSSLSGSATS
ncbi:hypothetical protein ACFLQ6_00575 [Thermoproteota archaeon]